MTNVTVRSHAEADEILTGRCSRQTGGLDVTEAAERQKRARQTTEANPRVPWSEPVIPRQEATT